MNDSSDVDRSTLSVPPNTDPRITHARALKSWSHQDRFLCNQLITLYSRSNLSSYAHRVFAQIPSPNVVSWTSLISAHADSLLSLRHFVSMLRRSALPNQRTVASLLRTCTTLLCVPFGLSLHSLSLKLGFANEPFSGSALISFYAKCRLAGSALKVFHEIPERDEVCYSAVVVGLAQSSRPIDALSAFADMQCCDIGSTVHSVSGALRAASELAALEQCAIIHAHAVVTGLDNNVVVASALIDGYGKAGLISDARCVFDENVAVMNDIGWNAMMSSYAQQGDVESAVKLFHEMEARGLVPDEYSFLAILTACCNAGLVVETENWLTRMRLEYALEPRLEHYTCLVTAMGNAGKLEEAKRLAMTMPFEPDAAVWRSLLIACGHHSDVDMARSAAEQLLELDPNDDSAYVIVANILSSSGRYNEVAEVRKRMKDRRVKKEGGMSWIEVRGEVHVFMSGDRKHERTEEVYSKLMELMEKIESLGYVPVWKVISHELGEKEKKEALWYHSEKLAVAFGLLNGVSPPHKALRIVKNLRICKDCHEVFKYISRAEEREIIVRDVNRYHRFLNGVCTCRDIW
ncbi:hypothetical protein NL676_021801 [Syzygium grande]|nr:hypothetical protein NL676_021801 [Syzygium grande]